MRLFLQNALPLERNTKHLWRTSQNYMRSPSSQKQLRANSLFFLPYITLSYLLRKC